MDSELHINVSLAMHVRVQIDPAFVLANGDNAYPAGSYRDFDVI